jgi:membrane-associated protease RseP (regulator of RpoE activity)
MKRTFVIVLAVVVLALVVVSGTVWAASNSAAPANTVQAAATPQATTDQAWLGIAVVDLNAQLSQRLGLSQTVGVAVTSVTANSPAASAGVKTGDLVTAVNGVAVKTAQNVVDEVRKNKVGDVVTLNITRGTESLSLKATTQATPANMREKLLNGLKGRLSPNLPSDLNPLQDVPADQIFGHNYGTTRTYTDKDGKVVTISTIPGVVTAISPTSITIKPNNPQAKGGPFSIDGTTRIVAGRGTSGTDAIAVGDKVTVTVVGDSAHASLISTTVAGVLGKLMNPPDGRNFQFNMPNGGLRGGRGFFGKPTPKATPAPGA